MHPRLATVGREKEAPDAAFKDRNQALVTSHGKRGVCAMGLPRACFDANLLPGDRKSRARVPRELSLPLTFTPLMHDEGDEVAIPEK